MSKKRNTRAIAAKLAWQVIDKGQSLSTAMNAAMPATTEEQTSNSERSHNDKGFVQELVYGVCRWYGALDHQASHLLAKPIRNKDRVLHFLLLIGLYQLRHTNIAVHAAVAETVAACQQLKRPWAKKMINGCLRNFQRQLAEPELTDQDSQSKIDQTAAYNQQAHPDWMLQAIKQAWPAHIEEILAANNQRPPMCLRVNQRVTNRDQYLQQLEAVELAANIDPYSNDGLILEKPVNVNLLPMFSDGAVSVQDTAAQLACGILDIQPEQQVLDACAAPGGKTAHMLERADNQLNMHALDISATRIEQLHGTLARLKLKAEVFVADASATVSWADANTRYDRILIDAPCSGLGVIRRHPDIKHHRRLDDIQQLQQSQQALLNQLWELLKPGGLMLYMTCSILPAENQQQIDAFLSQHGDAAIAEFEHPSALDLALGKQTLPGVHGMDGLYYCLLSKLDA